MPKHADLPYLSVFRNTTPRWGDYAHMAKTLHLAKNEVLLYVGEIPKYLFYLMKGELCFKFIDVEGREQSVQYMGEKSLVGETFFILGLPIRTTIVCTNAATILSFTPEQIFKHMLPHDSELLQDLLASLAYKVIFNSNRRLIETFDSVHVRICAFFLQYLQRNIKGESVIKLPWSLNELSCFLGIHRVTLYRAIKDMENQGIWKKVRLREFQVLDEHGLQRIALHTAVTVPPPLDNTSL